MNLLYLAANDPGKLAQAREHLGTVLPPDWTLSEDVAGATVILALDAEVTRQTVLSAGDSLRLVATTGSAVDAAGIPVVTLPTLREFSQGVVAEYAVMLMLVLSRNLFRIARSTAAQEWAAGRDQTMHTDQEHYIYNWIGLEPSRCLYGKVIGIVGLGGIGRAAAKLLRPFGARLLYTQRRRLAPAEERELGVRWRGFDDLLRESDVLTLHHRLWEGPGGNEGQFGAREFALMKSTAILVNTARGRVIDDEALVTALREGQIGGAGLDVFHYEPLPPDHPLLGLAGDNVILSPHLAAGSESEYWRYTWDELASVLSSA